ncbi:MAG: M81 family metallopeptidase [Candidatus Bathyarchaeia archaeon]
MKIAIGMMKHETNTFSTVNTTLEDFNPTYGEDFIKQLRGTRSEVGGFIKVLEEEGAEVIPTMGANATPSGPLVHEDYLQIVDTIVDKIGAEDVDGVLLALHGAMVAEDQPEAEAFLLERIRTAIGGKTPVIITLDLHGLISEYMVQQCDAIFGFDTNPHVDMYERGMEAAQNLVKAVKGQIDPRVRMRKLPMIPPTINQRTNEGPMVKLLEEAIRYEEQPKAINVCFFPAFPYADVPRAGSAVVVVTDGDVELASKIAGEMGDLMWSLREEFLKPLTPIKEAVKRAMETEEGPIILADVADNPGGGAPGDGTEILKELIEKGAKNVGVACIKDPEAVAESIRVGVRNKLKMEIGGKTDDFHGEPIYVEGTVRTITDGKFIHKAMAVGVPANVGRTAVIDVDGIELILTERSHAPNDPEIYRRNGIEPTDKKILVLKSRGHFRAAYEPFSKEVIEVDAPGLTTPNLEWFTYENIQHPTWPFDEF